jgi:outer membrane receptor protein involved in Fe transport
VYGADAVAGVVNFIMKTHFEGVQIDAGYNFYQHHNGDQASVAQDVTASGVPLPPSDVNTGFGKYGSVLMGSNFADNRGNATIYITYNNQGSSLQSSFDYSACSLGVTTLASGALGLTCAGSSTSARNGAGGILRVADSSGRPLPGTPYTADGLTNTLRPFGAQDLYNFGPLNYYLVPSERWTAGGFMNYDVNSHTTVYSSVMFMRNSAAAQIAPSGAFGVAAFIPCANPLLNAQEQATLCAPATLAAQGNPTENFNGVTYPGVNILIGRRNVEGGNRTFESRNDSNREVLGIRGDLGDPQRAWTYNISAQHSNVDVANRNANYTSNTAAQEALNVLPGGVGKPPVCGGATGGDGPLLIPPAGSVGFTPDPACVPWNVWKAGGVTPEALKFLSLPLNEQGFTQEYVVTGSVTGDFGKYNWKAPWADQGLRANFGAEYRQENSVFLPDFEEQQGNFGGGSPTPPIAGGFSVREIFTELRLPLASHQPFADELSIEGGYRYSRYSEGLDTNTYKLGLEWVPVRDVRFRGSYQRAVRAPNIGELFTPQAIGLDGSIDPCASPLANPANPTGPLKNGTTYQQCLAAGVKPAQYGSVVANPSPQYNGFLGGNPNLRPETADTYSVGVVLQPRFLQNLTVSVDYFNVKITDVIGVLGGNTVILKCLQTLEPRFCDLIHRDQFSSLWLTSQGFITDTTVNLGELRTKGIDVKGGYRLPINRFGSLLFSLEGTYTQQLETTPVAGFGSYDCIGFYGATCGAANPHWRHVFNTTWSTPWAGLDLNLRWRYLGPDTSEQTTSNPFLAGTPYLQ